MQSGKSHHPIVGDMHGLSAYRGATATWFKRAAHRCHRSRVKSDLKLVARDAMDAEDFDGAPVRSEAVDAWDLW